jgi:DNA-binding transcriptional LysR family regulator
MSRPWSARRKGERVRFGSGDMRVLLAAIRAGVGKELPVCLAEREPGLARLDAGPPDLIRVLHLHLHPDNVQTQRVQAVTRWLREEVKAAFGEPGLAAGVSAS